MAPARELMAALTEHRRIDFETALPDPRWSTDYLFGPARGQMFGVLVAREPAGGAIVLKSFSGQYDGHWNAPGWAPPLFAEAEFDAVMGPADLEIKRLGREILKMAPDDPKRPALRTRRRALSRQTMKRLHELYVLHNFQGETAALPPFYTDAVAPQTGAGDCCAPKLLNLAAQQGLQPLALAEFYFGAPNKFGTRHHGQFYPPCADKCDPILGWMLCGATP